MLTKKGSACSQLIGAPHDDGRIFSDKLSGTATSIKKTSSTAMAVESATTNVSPYISIKAFPRAGDITKLAANVADTRPYALERSSGVVTSAT